MEWSSALARLLGSLGVSGPAATGAGEAAPQAPETYEELRDVVTRFLRSLAGSVGARAAELGLVAPDLAVLLGRVLSDPRVEKKTKGELIAAAVYIVSPVDIVPEALFGPLGLADDVAVAARARDLLLNDVDPCIVRELWPGDGAVLERLQGLAKDLFGVFRHGFARGMGLLVRRSAEGIARRVGLSLRPRELPGA